MQVLVTYCNHQTTDLSMREQLAFSSQDQLKNAYHKFRSDYPGVEMVVLSTCNRVELYTAHEELKHAPSNGDIARFFSEFHNIPIQSFSDDLIAESGQEAVKHLFEVVSSVDSMVLGEPQIVNQVKEAYKTAQTEEACGPVTHSLFQRAINVSGRVRSETSLSEGRVSIASVAVGEFGKNIFDRFDDKVILIIGAGEMALETLRYLKNEGVTRVKVVNRSLENAKTLAEECDGEAFPFEQLYECMAGADIIVSTTGSDHAIVEEYHFRKLRKAANKKPVFILDLGAPRDFETGIADIDSEIFLYDIDDLETTCANNRKLRKKEVKKAKLIIEEESNKFMQDVYHQATGPIIKRLREEWHQVREKEVELLFRKLSHLEDPDRKEIEKSIERVVNKLLHPPLEVLRKEAKEGSPEGLLEALKRLFHLKD